MQCLEEVEGKHRGEKACSTAQEGEVIAELNPIKRSEVWLELNLSLLMNLLFVERFKRRVRLKFYFDFVRYFHQASLLSHILLQLSHSVQAETEYLAVFGLDVIFGVFLEGDRFGGYVNTLRGKANKNGRAMGGHADFLRVLLADDHKAPLPDHVVLEPSQSLFHSQAVLVAFLGKELYNHFSVGLAGEYFVLKVGLSQFLVVYNGSVVDQIVVFGLVEVRVSIRRCLPPASRPSGMTYSNKAALMIFKGFLDDLFNTFLFLLDRILGNLGLDRPRDLFGKGGYACTIISPILEQFDTLGNHYLCIVGCGDNANDAAALTFPLQHKGADHQSQGQGGRSVHPFWSKHIFERKHSFSFFLVYNVLANSSGLKVSGHTNKYNTLQLSVQYIGCDGSMGYYISQMAQGSPQVNIHKISPQLHLCLCFPTTSESQVDQPNYNVIVKLKIEAFRFCWMASKKNDTEGLRFREIARSY